MYYQYREQLKVAFGLIDDLENRREEREEKALEKEDRLI